MKRNKIIFNSIILFLCFSACKEDPAILQPYDIGLEKTFLEAKETSVWRYVRTFNGDTIVENPLIVQIAEQDSIIEGLGYKWFYEEISEDSLSAVFLFRLQDKTMYQTFYVNGDSTIIEHAPEIEFDKLLNESWEVSTSDLASRILYIDSVGFNYKGLPNVFRLISEEYWMGGFAAKSEWYWQMEVGLIQRRNIDNLNGNEFVMDLEFYEVNY